MNIMTASKRINKPNDIYSVVDTYTDSISENELNINNRMLDFLSTIDEENKYIISKCNK